MHKITKMILILIGNVLGAALGVFIICFIITDLPGSYLGEAKGVFSAVSGMELNHFEARVLDRMLDRGAILTPSQHLSETSSFYESVITILTTLIGALSVVAYMYVRSVSEESARKTVKDAVSDRLKSSDHEKHVDDKVKELVDVHWNLQIDAKVDGLNSYQEDLDRKISELNRYMEEISPVTIKDIYDRLEMISKHISLSDNDDDFEADGDGELRSE